MKNESSSSWDQVYPTLTGISWLLLLVMGSISFLTMSPAFTLGVVLGGLLIMLNFNLLQKIVCRAMPAKNSDTPPKKTSLILKSYLRLLVLGVMISLLLSRDWVDPIGLTLGLSVVVLGIVWFGIRNALETEKAG